MKMYPVIYLIAICIVLFPSCKEKDQIKGAKEIISQIETKLEDSTFPIEIIDTIWTTNAPSRITRKIRKDKEGNLLFASYDDIIRYDGVSFTKMNKEKGLKSYEAFDVWEDKNEGIWIASTLQGIFYYPSSVKTKDTKQAYNHFTIKSGLANNRAMCIYEDNDGRIWIGTEDGISCYDGETIEDGQLVFRNFNKSNGLTNSNINTIMEDKEGKLWIGTRGNLSVYDPLVKPKKDELAFTDITNEEGQYFENVWSIIEDKKGNIWFGGEHGLWHYDGHSFKNLSKINVMSIYEDIKGHIWFTHQAGFSRYNHQSLLSQSPKPTQIFSGKGMFFGITEDKDGNIWIGNLDAVLRYDGKSVSYFGNK